MHIIYTKISEKYKLCTLHSNISIQTLIQITFKFNYDQMHFNYLKMAEMIKHGSKMSDSPYIHRCSDTSVHNKALRHVGNSFIQRSIDVILSAAINIAPRESSIFIDTQMKWGRKRKDISIINNLMKRNRKKLHAQVLLWHRLSSHHLPFTRLHFLCLKIRKVFFFVYIRKY